jgi:TRAP-type C4-dicarboxylate transport system substrate-binding protein
MSPTVIAYDEIYNAIQNGVIQAGENEAAGVETMKFYEVGPNLNMTQHAITIRPICFSGKTFKKLPPELQAAILKAGKEAGIYGRQIESRRIPRKLDAMEAAGKLKKIPFTDRAAMKKAADRSWRVREGNRRRRDLRQDQLDVIPGGTAGARIPSCAGIFFGPLGPVGLGEDACANSSTATTGCSMWLLGASVAA